MRASIVAGLALLLAVAATARAQVPETLPPDVAFGRAVAAIRADVATGDELVQRRDWDVAYRHFMFPLEEVYGVIRADLKTYKTPPFDGALRTLARTARAHNVKQYAKALEKVRAAFAAADAGLTARQPDWPSFVVEVAVALLKTAPDEYDDAVVDGRIARPISYQVARSYILETDRMIESVAGDLSARNADALRAMRDNLSALKQTFAPVNAPKQPPSDLAQVSQNVDQFAAAAATAIKGGS